MLLAHEMLDEVIAARAAFTFNTAWALIHWAEILLSAMLLALVASEVALDLVRCEACRADMRSAVD